MRSSKTPTHVTWEGEGFTLEYTYQNGVYSMRVSKSDGDHSYSTPHASEVMPALVKILGFNPGWFPDKDVRYVEKYRNNRDVGDDNIEFIKCTDSTVKFRGSIYPKGDNLEVNRVKIRENGDWCSNVFLFDDQIGMVVH